MNNTVCHFIALSAVLASITATGHAMTLGDLRGSAVIGRSLGLSVPVVGDMGEEVLASCMSAEVLFGDQRQLATSIALTPVHSRLVSMTTVKIQSDSVVNEPIVTVILRSTCGSTTTRRYVLLTDFPAPDLPKAEASLAAERLFAPVADRQPEATPHAAAGAAVSGLADTTPKLSASGLVQHHAARARPVAPKPTASTPKKTMRPSPPMKASTEPELGRPVLKLDESMVLPVLAETPHLADVPASAPSGNTLKLAVRIETLQSDVRALADLAQIDEANLAAFQSELRQAESERVSLTWLYLLTGLLLVTLATLTWVLNKQRGAPIPFPNHLHPGTKPQTVLTHHKAREQ